jgi:hypothetical protein
VLEPGNDCVEKCGGGRSSCRRGDANEDKSFRSCGKDSGCEQAAQLETTQTTSALCAGEHAMLDSNSRLSAGGSPALRQGLSLLHVQLDCAARVQHLQADSVERV